METLNPPPLTDAEINTAIQKGIKDETGKIFIKQAGVHLYDKWRETGAVSDKTGTQTAGFYVDLYTPAAWIEYQAVLAHRKMMNFTLAVVTPEMRREVVRVIAHPDMPRQVSARGMSGASNVDHVVLQDSDKKVVIQPKSEIPLDQVAQSALSAPITMHGQTAEFSIEDFRSVRGADGQGEFYITVIGDTKKDFKVKSMDFAKL